MSKMSKRAKDGLWELIGYISLILCVVGQIIVGKWYILAQTAYLVANVASVIRDIAIGLPRANRVRDICFTGITVALLVCRLF